MRSPTRLAAVDIGTSSVKLLLARRNSRDRLTPLWERVWITRLGQGLDARCRLRTEAMQRTLAAIGEAVRSARRRGAACVQLYATRALREARNARTFIELVRNRLLLPLTVLSPAQEARASLRGALAGTPGPLPAWILDVGGGSTELALGSKRSSLWQRSFSLGAVRLTERWVHRHPVPPDAVDLLFRKARQAFRRATLPASPAAKRLIGVGGTVTTLAAIASGTPCRRIPETHRKSINLMQIASLLDTLSGMSLSQRARVKGLPARRADIIVAGAAIFLAAMQALGLHECTVSTWGLRHGVLLEQDKER